MLTGLSRTNQPAPGVAPPVMPIPAAIAPHQLRTQGPLCELTMHGKLELQHAHALTDTLTGQLTQHGIALVLLDIDDGKTGATVETRRHLAKWAEGRTQHLATALVGGGLLIRTMMQMVGSAVRLLSPSKSVTIKQFESSQRTEALAWLRSCEPKLRAGLPPEPKSSASD